jgi:hypothetical protein
MKKFTLIAIMMTVFLSPSASAWPFQSWSELKTPDEKYAGASLNALLQCRGDKGLAKPGEAEAAWDKLMPGKTGMGFLDKPDGMEAVRILSLGLDQNCKFSAEGAKRVPNYEKAKLQKILEN